MNIYIQNIKRIISSFTLIIFSFIVLNAQTYNDWIDKSFEALEKDSFPQAEEYLKKALRIEPASPLNYMLLANLGTVQRQLGKFEDALISYNSALMVSPKSLPLLDSRASLYAELEQWDKAEEDYTTILYIEMDNEEALYRRGLIRLERGDSIAARIDFETILKNNSISAKARLGIAALLKKSHDYVMAAEMYTQVLKGNSENKDILLKRAEVYYLDGKYSKAITDINKSIYIDPEYPMAYMIRGRIRYSQLDNPAALKDFQKAKELGFNEPLVEEWIKKCK